MIRRVGMTLFGVAWLNFMAFWFVGVALGGDAVVGKVEGGHYYLASHGRYTEVSRAVWTYIRVHTISVLITHPLGLLAGIGSVWYSDRTTAAAAAAGVKGASG